MKCSKIFRILSIAIILSLLVVVIPATPALAAMVIELSPEKGKIGDTITIIGTGFTASTETTEKHVDIYFAADTAGTTDDIGIKVNTYEFLKSPAIGYVDEPDEGEFETTFTVPAELNGGTDDEDVEPGTYYIYVTLFNTTRIKAAAEFTVIGGKVTIDPDAGPVGTEVEISGTDFGASEDIFVEYDGEDIDIESGDDKTDRYGEFEGTIIIIPKSTAGNHTITVIGEDSGAEAEATFTVEPGITVSPTSGAVETSVTVSGTGFGNRSDFTIDLNQTEVATGTTDRYGGFDTTFNVPAMTSGTYALEVRDEDNNSYEVEFTIIATTANLNPTTGHVGTEVTVSGAGYTAGGTVTIKYDATEVATATVKTDKTFSTTFAVPTSQYGDHDVIVSDDTTEEFTFTMESAAPPIPQPLLPQMGVKAKQPVHFDWKDVTDDSLPVTYSLQIATRKDFVALSIVLEKTGLTESEYTIIEAEKLSPISKEEPYYWRIKAVDSASNESEWTGVGEFYTGVAFAMPDWAMHMPDWAMYALFGIGGLFLFIIGIWVGRRTAYYSY